MPLQIQPAFQHEFEHPSPIPITFRQFANHLGVARYCQRSAPSQLTPQSSCHGESSRAMADNKQARLTDAQKKANHIESERKRREAIREGFDRLSVIVPGMGGQGRSEAVVLANSVQYLLEEKHKRDEIKKVAMSRGMSERAFDEVYRKAGDASKADALARAGGDSNTDLHDSAATPMTGGTTYNGGTGNFPPSSSSFNNGPYPYGAAYGRPA